jgi:hypothetical protein
LPALIEGSDPFRDGSQRFGDAGVRLRFRNIFNVATAIAVAKDRLTVKHKGGEVVEILRNAWLVYSILKEARGNWSKIREVLVDVGLSHYEITTLKLSQYTKKPIKKKKKRGKA